MNILRPNATNFPNSPRTNQYLESPSRRINLADKNTSVGTEAIDLDTETMDCPKELCSAITDVESDNVVKISDLMEGAPKLDSVEKVDMAATNSDKCCILFSINARISRKTKAAERYGYSVKGDPFSLHRAHTYAAICTR